MNNLRLIPDTHRHEPIEKTSFTYDRELIALVKAQKGARWSQTLRSWYFLTKEFMINYRVQNIEELVEKLKAEGVNVLDEITHYDYGKFVHILDEEGNKLELWEPIDHVFTAMGGATTK